MKETRMPPAHAADLVANSGNVLYGFRAFIINLSYLLFMFDTEGTGDSRFG